MQRILPFLLLYFIAGAAFGQQRIVKTVAPAKAIVQFEKAEWDITLAAPFQNPYDQKEIMLDMVITAPSGKPWVLPCYYDNGEGQAPCGKHVLRPAKQGCININSALRQVGVRSYAGAILYIAGR